MKNFYKLEKIEADVLPKRGHPIKKLRSAWNLVCPSIYEELSCIQIDKKFIVSFGAHYTHHFAILGLKNEIDFFTAQKICDLMSFVFDTIVDVNFSLKKRDSAAIFTGLPKYTKLLRSERATKENLHQQLVEIKESLAVLQDGYQRIFPIVPAEHRGKFLSLKIPTNSNLLNALFAYRQALLSIDPAGAILNFWRVFEAVGPTKTGQGLLLGDFFKTALQPILVIDRAKSDKAFDLIPKYKSYLKPYHRKLLTVHGSNDEIMKFFYKSRRCASAHAHTGVLSPSPTTSLADLYSDALMLKNLARMSIQRYFDSI